MTANQALERALRISPNATQFVVRHYDGFDNAWSDVSDPCDAAKAKRIWSQKTEGGTKATRYADIDYYAIYPVDTTMVHSEKGNRELGIDTIR